MGDRLAHGGITEGNESSIDHARFLPNQSSEDAGFSLEDSLAHGSLNLQGQFEKHVKDQKDRGDSVVDSFFQYVLAHDPTELGYQLPDDVAAKLGIRYTTPVKTPQGTTEETKIDANTLSRMQDSGSNDRQQSSEPPSSNLNTNPTHDPQDLTRTTQDDGTITYSDPVINEISKFYKTDDATNLGNLYAKRKIYQNVVPNRVERGESHARNPDPDYVTIDRQVRERDGIPKKKFFTEVQTPFPPNNDFKYVREGDTEEEVDVQQTTVTALIQECMESTANSTDGRFVAFAANVYAEALREPMNWENLWKYRSSHYSYVHKRLSQVMLFGLDRAKKDYEEEVANLQPGEDPPSEPMYESDFIAPTFSDKAIEVARNTWIAAQAPIILQQSLIRYRDFLSTSHAPVEPQRYLLSVFGVIAQQGLRVLEEGFDKADKGVHILRIDHTWKQPSKGLPMLPTHISHVNRGDPLQFPTFKPPENKTHFHGRYVQFRGRSRPVWVEYPGATLYDLLNIPPNMPTSNNHWKDRIIPGTDVKIKSFDQVERLITTYRTQAGLKFDRSYPTGPTYNPVGTDTKMTLGHGDDLDIRSPIPYMPKNRTSQEDYAFARSSDQPFERATPSVSTPTGLPTVSEGVPFNADTSTIQHNPSDDHGGRNVSTTTQGDPAAVQLSNLSGTDFFGGGSSTFNAPAPSPAPPMPKTFAEIQANLFPNMPVPPSQDAPKIPSLDPQSGTPYIPSGILPKSTPAPAPVPDLGIGDTPISIPIPGDPSGGSNLGGGGSSSTPIPPVPIDLIPPNLPSGQGQGNPSNSQPGGTNGNPHVPPPPSSHGGNGSGGQGGFPPGASVPNPGGDPPGGVSASSFVPSYSKTWSMKPDISLFPYLRDGSRFMYWYKEHLTIAHGTNLAECTNFNYMPSASEYRSFINKCKWHFVIIDKTVHTTEGRDIIERYRPSHDGRITLYMLLRFYAQATSTHLRARDLMEKLATVRLTSSWSKPYVDFIAWFIRTARQYNETVVQDTDRLHMTVLRAMLERSVSACTPLAEIKQRELYSLAQGNAPLTFNQYVALLMSAAQVLDSKRGTRLPSRNRQGNLHQIEGDPSPGDDDHSSSPDDGNHDELVELDAYLAQRVPGSSMNKETWTSLDSNTQKIWDTIPPDDKAKILNYAKGRVQQEANMSMGNIVEPPSDSNDDSGTPTPEPDASPEPEPSIEANSTRLSEKQASTHPGDVRRMMSRSSSRTGNSKPKTLLSKPKTMSSNTVRWSSNDTIWQTDPSDGRGDTLQIPSSDSLPPFHSSDSHPDPSSPAASLDPTLYSDPFSLQDLWNEDRTGDFW